MKLYLPGILMFFWLSIPAFSQENPVIDKKHIVFKTGNKKIAAGNLKRGDYYYSKKIYDEALSYYLKLYQYTQNHSPLNYKIGVSSLYGTNPKKALDYFLITTPETASDYYYQLGKAYQQSFMYTHAKEAFKTYILALPLSQQIRVADEIRQLTRECEFAGNAIRDSIPVFIINMGPNINSYYDDYAAVQLIKDSLIFFTSRRPNKDLQKGAGPSEFKERIFYTTWNGDDNPSEAIEVAKLSGSKNRSVSGAYNSQNKLFYYKGKNKNGNIRSAIIETGKIRKKSRIKGKVNTKAYQETTLTVSDTGDGYFVSKRRNGVGGKDIWHVQRKGDKRFTKPRNMGPTINSTGDEEAVFVTPDGQTLYFSSNGHPGMGGFDIYRIEKDETGTWGKPINMGYPINSPGDELFYHPTADSTLAFFATKRQGGFGGLDIYLIKKDPRIPFELSGIVTDKATGRVLPALVTLYSNIDQLPAGSAYVDTLAFKYILNMDDGGDFYIQADAPGYRSVTESFESPKERYSKVSRNFSLEKLLFPYTLWGTISNEKTGTPVQAELLFKPLNKDTVIYRVVSNAQTGFYSITFEDKTNLAMEVIAQDFFGHKENLMLRNEQKSSGEKNITLTRSISTYTITGVVREEQTMNHLPALIRVYQPNNQTPLQSVKADIETGKYELNFDNTGPFLLEVTAEGYFFQNMNLHFHPDSMLMVKNFDLQKIKTGARIVIANILFNTGNATLRAESYGELNKLVNLLRENPQVRIEVSGHTDNVGSAAVNKKLSRSRALSVKNYLVSQGISGDRVDFEGYGFDRPIAPNETAEGRAANRRVEIEVLD